MIISWTPPSDNGAEITSYTISIRQSDGVTFTVDSVDCDGSDSTIVSQTQCTVPLATLTSAPYSLSFGDSIYAKVIATNVKGDSIESDEGNGAIIITVPDAPINLAEDITHRTVTTIGLTWTAGASNGGSEILDYRISFAE